jgi:hypothetical protein
MANNRVKIYESVKVNRRWNSVSVEIPKPEGTLYFVSVSLAKRWQQVGYVLLEAAIFSRVVWLNMRAARRLARRIAELDRERCTV